MSKKRYLNPITGLLFPKNIIGWESKSIRVVHQLELGHVRLSGSTVCWSVILAVCVYVLLSVSLCLTCVLTFQRLDYSNILTFKIFKQECMSRAEWNSYRAQCKYISQSPKYIFLWNNIQVYHFISDVLRYGM